MLVFQVPGILGPGGNIYITDHHHFTAAMSGTKYSDLSVVACPLHDLRSTTEPDNFWAEMMNNGWVWMEDNRVSIPANPHTLMLGM